MNFDGLRIPKGWTIAPIGNETVVLSSPAPHCYQATIDFSPRGVRHGDWKQAVVDDAVAHIRTLLVAHGKERS